MPFVDGEQPTGHEATCIPHFSSQLFAYHTCPGTSSQSSSVRFILHFFPIPVAISSVQQPPGFVTGTHAFPHVGSVPTAAPASHVTPATFSVHDLAEQQYCFFGTSAQLFTWLHVFPSVHVPPEHSFFKASWIHFPPPAGQHAPRGLPLHDAEHDA